MAGGATGVPARRGRGVQGGWGVGGEPAHTRPRQRPPSLATQLCPDARPVALAPDAAAKEQYKPPKPGEPVYRGHRSFDLVQQLQLGLTYSIAQSQNTVCVCVCVCSEGRAGEWGGVGGWVSG